MKKQIIAVGTSGAALLGGGQLAVAEEANTNETADESSHCVLDIDANRLLGCFDSFLEAQALVASPPQDGYASTDGTSQTPATGDVTTQSSIVLAWHYEHHNGGGDSITITGSSCSGTWYPSSTWANKMSSTKLGPSCSTAKHYTLSSCGGDYQIVNAEYPNITNLGNPLNDNSHCVKYA
ncbi:MAG: hypothetical protein U5R31_16890 [Acidimicrobiia bacterium]|nr:hypothetical protein [Acidimicrobiia bacterium]